MRTRLFQVEVTWLCTLVTDMWFETMSGFGVRDLPQVPVQIARCGGADVLCDDGRGWRERTADRRPRSDKGFETAHGEGTNL